jgi:hypothetical protein
MYNEYEFMLIGLPICLLIAIALGICASFLTYQNGGFGFMTAIVFVGGYSLGLFIGACMQGWK